MASPSGWLLYAAPALRLKLVPVMPGAAAWAGTASSIDTATATAGRNRHAAQHTLLFKRLMVALLRGYHYFGHQPAEVLGVVGQMIELRGVEEIGARRHAGAVDDHIEGFAAAQGD